MVKEQDRLVAKVIVIADDQRNATLLKVWLEAKGYRCIVVKNEEESEARTEAENSVGIFYGSEFQFQFLQGKLEAYHVYEGTDRARHFRRRNGA